MLVSAVVMIRSIKNIKPVLLFACLLLITGLSFAQQPPAIESGEPASLETIIAESGSGLIPGLPAFTVTPRTDGGEDYTVTIQLLMLMTALTLLPSFLLLMTSFTRIIVVFAILRQALGLQQTPSNLSLIHI